MAELFDVEDLTSFMQATLDGDRAEIAQRVATSAIKSYLRPFDPTATGTFTVYIPVESDEVTLPRLLTTVTAVSTVDGVGTPLPYTYRPGAPTLRLGSFYAGNFYPTRHVTEAKLTYTYAVVPAEVRDAALLTAAAVYGTPGEEASRGLRSQTVGGITETYVNQGTETLIPLEAKELLAGFRSPRRSVRLRA